MITTTQIATPIGTMIAGAVGEQLCLFDFQYRRSLPSIMTRISRQLGCNYEAGYNLLFDELQWELNAYFAGDLTSFKTPVCLIGSPFQQGLWQTLLTIKYGEQITYNDLALRMGPTATIEDVKRANGANGLAILVPCHRVVGDEGALIGYGGGLAAKKRLLALESGSGVYSLQRHKRTISLFNKLI